MGGRDGRAKKTADLSSGDSERCRVLRAAGCEVWQAADKAVAWLDSRSSRRVAGAGWAKADIRVDPCGSDLCSWESRVHVLMIG